MKAVLAVLSLAVAAAQAGLLAAPAAVVPGSVAHHTSFEYSYAPTFIPKPFVAAARVLPASVAIQAPAKIVSPESLLPSHARVLTGPSAIAAPVSLLSVQDKFLLPSHGRVLAAPASLLPSHAKVWDVSASLPLARAAIAAPLGDASYVAATRGAVHTADLPGHFIGSQHVNVAPAPGTF